MKLKNLNKLFKNISEYMMLILIDKDHNWSRNIINSFKNNSKNEKIKRNVKIIVENYIQTLYVSKMHFLKLFSYSEYFSNFDK